MERRDQINFFLSNGIGQEPAVQQKYSGDFPFGPNNLNALAGVYDDLIPLFNLVGKSVPGATYPMDIGGGAGASSLPGAMENNGASLTCPAGAAASATSAAISRGAAPAAICSAGGNAARRMLSPACSGEAASVAAGMSLVALGSDTV